MREGRPSSGGSCGGAGAQMEGGGRMGGGGAWGIPRGGSGLPRTRPQHGALESPQQIQAREGCGRGAHSNAVESCDDEKPARLRARHPSQASPERCRGPLRARPGRPTQSSRARDAGVQTEGVRGGASPLSPLRPLPPPPPAPRPSHLVLCVDLHARVCEEGGHDRGVPTGSRPVQRGAAILQGRGGRGQSSVGRAGRRGEGSKGHRGTAHGGYPEGRAATGDPTRPQGGAFGKRSDVQ